MNYPMGGEIVKINSGLISNSGRRIQKVSYWQKFKLNSYTRCIKKHKPSILFNLSTNIP